MAQSTVALLEDSAEAAPAQRQSQVNARIDATLKATGDAGLAAAGYTPTQAVRALWALASRSRFASHLIRMVTLRPMILLSAAVAWRRCGVARALSIASANSTGYLGPAVSLPPCRTANFATH